MQEVVWGNVQCYVTLQIIKLSNCAFSNSDLATENQIQKDNAICPCSGCKELQFER